MQDILPDGGTNIKVIMYQPEFVLQVKRASLISDPHFEQNVVTYMSTHYFKTTYTVFFSSSDLRLT